MRYRSKPHEIEAVQYGGSSTDGVAIRHWMAGNEYQKPAITTRDIVPLRILNGDGGELLVERGDFVVKHSDGAFCPYPASDFLAVYEPVPPREEGKQ